MLIKSVLGKNPGTSKEFVIKKAPKGKAGISNFNILRLTY